MNPRLGARARSAASASAGAPSEVAVAAINARSFPLSTNGAAAFTASTSSSSGVSTSPSFDVQLVFTRKSICCSFTSSAPRGKRRADASASKEDVSASEGNTASWLAAALGDSHPVAPAASRNSVSSRFRESTSRLARGFLKSTGSTGSASDASATPASRALVPIESKTSSPEPSSPRARARAPSASARSRCR